MLNLETRDAVTLPGFMVETPSDPLGERSSKRVLDLVLLILSLPAWAPLMVLIAIAVRLDSPGDVFFKHTRIGFGGRKFEMWKFRTMITDGQKVLDEHLASCPTARAEWEATQKLKSDPRITRIGSFLRRFSLDELPQLWNVVLGEMSLVGPRPMYDPNELRIWGPKFRYYVQAKPGLTGLWQVSGRNDTTYEERIHYDELYVRGWSLALDVNLIMRTFSVVLSGKGAY